MATVNPTYDLHELHGAINTRLKDFDQQQLIRRLWDRDTTLWGANQETADRLGWLTLPTLAETESRLYVAFAKELLREKFSCVVVLGMGGSSMAPEVIMDVMGSGSGYPVLRVIDTTHPATILRHEKAIDLPRTLFLVAGFCLC